jgi:putative protease
LRREGKKIYITTPTAPRGNELEKVEEIFQIARDIEVDGMEFHNLGILYKASRELGEIPAQAGVFANIYTQVAASMLKEYGVVRVRPNVEVSLEEMEIIEKESPVAVSLTLHGKIPLGIVADCFLLEEGKKGEDCPEACLNPAWLKARDWTIKHVGKGIYSGLDLCLVEHLDRIIAKGFRYFRVESGYETGAYRNEVGKVYREGLERALSGTFSTTDEWRGVLKKNARLGFCNGYLFGRSGRVYIDRSGKEISR